MELRLQRRRNPFKPPNEFHEIRAGINAEVFPGLAANAFYRSRQPPLAIRAARHHRAAAVENQPAGPARSALRAATFFARGKTPRARPLPRQCSIQWDAGDNSRWSDVSRQDFCTPAADFPRGAESARPAEFETAACCRIPNGR